MAKLISKTYGDALFDVAVEKNAVDSLDREAAAVAELIKQNPEFLNLLKHPNIGKEEKLSVVEKVFSHDFALGDTTAVREKHAAGHLERVMSIHK